MKYTTSNEDKHRNWKKKKT